LHKADSDSTLASVIPTSRIEDSRSPPLVDNFIRILEAKHKISAHDGSWPVVVPYIRAPFMRNSDSGDDEGWGDISTSATPTKHEIWCW
ncbi:722_t:CDS:2, partial [Acaulospora colombiana]